MSWVCMCPASSLNQYELWKPAFVCENKVMLILIDWEIKPAKKDSNNAFFFSFFLHMLQGLEGRFVKWILMSASQTHVRMVAFAWMALTCISAYAQRVSCNAIICPNSQDNIIILLIQTLLVFKWAVKQLQP